MAKAESHLPVFVTVGELRCFHRTGIAGRAICGAPASWMRPANGLFSVAYFCDEHRAESDVSLQGVLVVRRVRVQADIVLCGVSLDAAIAQGEAIARLEEALQAAGGVLGVVAVSSAVGRVAHPSPFSALNASAAKG